MSWPWSELGLDGPASLSDVRHAYVECLKETHPEDDPEGFQRLHDAYQAARRAAKKGQSQPDISFVPQKTGEHNKQQPHTNKKTEDASESFEKNKENGETAPAQEEQSWEFDELLEPIESHREPKPAQQEKTWNYEEIFRQEQQEQANQRRQQYYGKTGEANKSDDWEAVDSALQVIYELFEQERPLSEWMSFFYSANFFRVKGNPDFIIGLEEFLKQAQTLDASVRRALIRIYGLEAEYVPAIYRHLRQVLCFNQLLYGEEQKKRKRGVRLGLLSLILGLILTFAILPRIAENFTVQRMCHYMEEDFGCAVEATQVTYHAQARRYTATDTPELYFITTPDGRRDIKNGKLGYTTNYGNAVVGKALRDFAAKWHYVILQYQEESLISVNDSGGERRIPFI